MTLVEAYSSHNGRHRSDVISRAFEEADLIDRHSSKKS